MNDVLRILVTGTRHTDPADSVFVHATLDRITRHHTGEIIIVQGACEYGGVDQAAHVWARNRPGGVSESHPAKRAPTTGRILGPARNAHMVSLGASLCLAFPKPDSKGTWDCIRKAVAAGIPTYIYPLGASSRRTP